ncbi:MAG TPA: MaoC/PaaZ C-terminal domain-containing protein [Candidatus Rubrimentiphilum sp.]|nr:MaoC/PaaZ C-terminal domain-containing protein [Candidatus Rubrimentiphilum sp.]
MKVFDASDQNHFASLSGDCNPIHTDPILARRTQAGDCVVHGVHAVLWALDTLIERRLVKEPIAALDVRFQKFLYAGAGVEINVRPSADASLRIELISEDIITTTIDVLYGEPAGETRAVRNFAPVSCTSPQELDLENIVGASGRLANDGSDRVAAEFPHVSRAIGPQRAAAITRLSMLVGMVCPGLNSIFSSFSIRMTSDAPESDLTFEVFGVDERFRMAEIAVAGAGIAGTVVAFVRRPPVQQPSLEELRPLVGGDEFAGTTALIVGGSRGLGALTGKLIAAGGGRIALTYATGESDALAIAQEIGTESSRVLPYDARKDAQAQIARLEWKVDQIYYFATTPIFRQKTRSYSPARFSEFCEIYIDGFADLCSALRANGNTPLRAFYPSSIAVKTRPRDLTEYAMAKAGGEILCADMNRFVRDLRVLVRRLPRLLTDQTATVMPSETADAVETMLPIVREMHGPF